MLPLAICIAGQYARMNRSEVDDLISMALLGIAKALNNLDGMVDNNLKGYCIPKMHSACAHYDFKKSFGPTDYRTRAKNADYYKQVELDDRILTPPKAGYTVADVMEVIEVLDGRERVVFDMIHQGWTLRDIASELGQSYDKIYRIWQVARRKIIRALEDA